MTTRSTTAARTKKATKVDAAAETIRRRIIDGEYAVGDRLPPERELAPDLGVHRLTLRTALDRLTVDQLVHPKQGSGYTVRPFLDVGGPRLLKYLGQIADGPQRATICRDLLEVRRALAGMVLGRLASNRSVDLAAVRIAIGALEACADGGDDVEVATRDLAVLRVLLRGTGSEVLQLLYNPVAAAVLSNDALRAALYAEPADNVAGWNVLAAWLEAPTAEAIPMILEEIERRDAATLRRLPR